MDRSHDTVYIIDSQQQYKYKLLRDTLYKIQTDSIPVIKTITVEKQVRYIPSWCKWLACLGAITILIAMAVIAFKLWSSSSA